MALKPAKKIKLKKAIAKRKKARTDSADKKMNRFKRLKTANT